MKITRVQFCALVHSLVTRHHASVTSWYRTAKRNKEVGGRLNSAHLAGYAVDLVLDDPAHKPLLISDATDANLNCVDYGQHVHVEVDPLDQA